MKYTVYGQIRRECGKKARIRIDITEDPKAFQAQYPDRDDFLFVPFGSKIGQTLNVKKRC